MLNTVKVFYSTKFNMPCYMKTFKRHVWALYWNLRVKGYTQHQFWCKLSFCCLRCNMLRALQLSRLYIHCYISYMILRRVCYIILNGMLLLKRYQDFSLPEKGILICIKFVSIFHAYLHLQNNIFCFSYLHKLFSQIIDVKTNKQRKW